MEKHSFGTNETQPLATMQSLGWFPPYRYVLRSQSIKSMNALSQANFEAPRDAA